MRKCIKTRFSPLQMFKNIFFKDMILLVWKYAKKHQNTILTAPDGQNYLFFWWSGSMRKSIKTRF
jgi:hypothetical protein